MRKHKDFMSEPDYGYIDIEVVSYTHLFKNKVITDARGNEQVIDGEMAQAIYFDMVVNGYVDKKGCLLYTS